MLPQTSPLSPPVNQLSLPKTQVVPSEGFRACTTSPWGYHQNIGYPDQRCPAPRVPLAEVRPDNLLVIQFLETPDFPIFPFPENSGTLTFPISGNSGLRHFLSLVICSCISPFTCDSVVFPCFMLLFSLMYSDLSLYPVHTCPTP